MRICVVCHDLVVAGGIFRFERFGRVSQALGHKIVFVRLNPAVEPPRQIAFDVINFETAASQNWDATMIPGAGFPAETIARFSEFKRPSFGLRVQHILNDHSLKSRFLAVNANFEPDFIVLNNRHWTSADLSDLRADKTVILEGAVDTNRFRPIQTRPGNNENRPFVIGGLSNKNPAPLIEAVRQLGDVELRLFGRPNELANDASDLITAGRLKVYGILNEAQLPDFYQGLDCVVHTEKFAGWANLGAEAMASGAPLICTPHGTLAFAEHEATALVIDTAEPSSIAASVSRLRAEPDLARRLARNGRKRIEKFTWEHYTEELLRILTG